MMERYLSKYVGKRAQRLGHRKDMRVAFDVDRTLIDEQDRPIYSNIQLLLWFVDRGYNVIVWSGGGIDYAELWVRRLGLEKIVRVIEKGIETPELAFDDERVNLGSLNVEV